MEHGFTILLIGIVIVFTGKGTIVDFIKRKIKYYVRIFYIKTRNLENIDDYIFISLLQINRTSYGCSRTMVQSSERKVIYRICLLKKNHKSQLLIKDFKDENNGLLKAKQNS